MKSPKLQEILTIMDDGSWLWPFAQKVLAKFSSRHEYVRLRATTPIRQSWMRFRHAPAILIHWEAKFRSGGALVEEILEVDPNFEIAKKIIILTSDPIHEDVVYFSELGLRKIVRVRNREKDIESWSKELEGFLQDAFGDDSESTNVEVQWRRLLHQIDVLPVKDADANLLQSLEAKVMRLRITGQAVSARELDALASITYRRGDYQQAVKLWEQSLARNPNYFRAYNNVIRAFRDKKDHMQALNLMQKMHQLNRSRISRLVSMGEVHLEMNDEKKAEHCFQSALERDEFCSSALNGMAEIKFRQGNLEMARTLLEKSQIAYRCAQRLNQMGIDMVQKEHFKEALDHYSKAQYVLPQQEKGPQLFYNIGLCYARWGKFGMAREFLKLALIKAPDYKKAQKLLEQVAVAAQQPSAA